MLPQLFLLPLPLHLAIANAHQRPLRPPLRNANALLQPDAMHVLRHVGTRFVEILSVPAAALPPNATISPRKWLARTYQHRWRMQGDKQLVHLFGNALPRFLRYNPFHHRLWQPFDPEAEHLSCTGEIYILRAAKLDENQCENLDLNVLRVHEHLSMRDVAIPTRFRLH
ncbi:hypothetical protein CPC08DRAFT_771798 [Agrocybe pediades]|nr:hypothetical protein CPC08DRAFT_771798 [Agrocybe pediades]